MSTVTVSDKGQVVIPVDIPPVIKFMKMKLQRQKRLLPATTAARQPHSWVFAKLQGTSESARHTAPRTGMLELGMKRGATGDKGAGGV